MEQQFLPRRIVFIRHAEKQKKKYPLSDRGMERARRLVKWVDTTLPNKWLSGEKIDLIYTPEPHPNGGDMRPRQTMCPTAFELGLPIFGTYKYTEVGKAAKTLLTRPEWKDKNILICWEHNCLPRLLIALAEKMGKEEWQKTRIWASSDFSSFFLIDFSHSLFHHGCQDLFQTDSENCFQPEKNGEKQEKQQHCIL